MIRRITLVLIVLVGVAAIAILVLGNPDVGRLAFSRHHLKACFDDVQGLHSGAPVRLAGVQIGTVRRVQAYPQRKDCPAEIEMDVATSYEIEIPKDSMVEVATAGVLGEIYIQIDSSHASGPPIENYGYLRTKPTASQPSIQDFLNDLDRTVKAAETLRAIQQANCGQTAAPSALQPRHQREAPPAPPR